MLYSENYELFNTLIGGFACPNNPESYAGWSLVLLIGPPMPDRGKGRGLTKSGPPGWGFGTGPTTLSC